MFAHCFSFLSLKRVQKQKEKKKKNHHRHRFITRKDTRSKKKSAAVLF